MQEIEDFSKLKAKLVTYIENEDDINLIEKAYHYALNHHEGQKRKSGEPYITHPISVAFILASYKSDPTTIMAGLLHDCIEDTSATYEEVKDAFGDEVALLTEGVTKLGQYKFKGMETKEEEKQIVQAKNYQKMLLAMAKDIRVIIVKLADRLHNMRTLENLGADKQKRIARETLDIFAPLAHRLGMYVIKAELEDTSFKYLYPDKYKQIAQMIKDTKKNRQEDLERMRMELEKLLGTNNFDYNVKGRIKNIYSVYKKMRDRNKEFDDIYDLLALRIIVKSVEQCYSAIGVIHSKYTPIPNRFKDYIAMPKPNLYQSLHTSVISHGKIYEVQIRTHQMDEIAEYGIAAHWAYKDKGSKMPMTQMVSSRLKWYDQLIKFTEERENDEEVLNLLRDDIFQSNVYVFTPEGDIIDLPKGSTPIDFAFRIHTEVGIKTVGAIVNSKIVPLEYALETGDVVEIKTSKNSFGPNDNWLKIAKTSGAKSKIKNYLNKQRKDVLIEMGKEEYDKEKARRKPDHPIHDKDVEKHLSYKSINDLETLYYEIGKNTITARNALNALLPDQVVSEDKLIESINRSEKKPVAGDSNIIVEGLDTPSVKLSNCCTPIPGDPIKGYISKGSGIAVHRSNCNNLKSLDESRYIDVEWGPDRSTIHHVNLKLIVNNRDNILADIINSVTTHDGKVDQVSATTNKRREGVIKIKVGVRHRKILDNIIVNLQKVGGVMNIERLMK